jgi:predicted ArsR family transcriptional regulator
MIIQSVNLYQFRDAFVRAGRGDQFSYDGLSAIFDYLEELSDDTGENIELDVIAICCEFAESDWESIASDYNIDLTDCEDDEQSIDAVRDYLESHTSLVGESEGSFVYANF